MTSASRGEPIGLVGCVKTKRSVTTAAKDLYDSPLFHGQRQTVETSCDRWYILSAKHGLLDPETEVAPYEEALYGTSRHHKRSWSRRVLAELREELGDLDGMHFEVHAGQDYYAHGLVEGLRKAGATVGLPTQRLSMGQKLSYYRSGERPTPPQPPVASQTSASHTRATTTPREVVPPRGKYRPLYDHLKRLAEDRWDAAFDDVETVLGTQLPASARNHPAWWANETVTHSHARAWVAAGFHTMNVNLTGERVTFVRAWS